MSKTITKKAAAVRDPRADGLKAPMVLTIRGADQWNQKQAERAVEWMQRLAKDLLIPEFRKQLNTTLRARLYTL